VAEYGIPYMGSKGAIAEEIVRIFPKADNFYDVFGGGFSITHAMLKRRSKDFQNFYFNEIKTDVVELIQKAIAGDFDYAKFTPAWVSREDFFAGLNDPYIRCFWSFGNNQRGYLFSKEIEPYKKSMHNAVVFNEFDELAEKVFHFNSFQNGYSIYQRRIFLRHKIEYYRLNGIPEFLLPFLSDEQLQQLERLQKLDRLQKLEQLEQLERMQQLGQVEQVGKLHLSAKSYESLTIHPGSIVYCDPPYKGTGDYGNEFNTEDFLDWAHAQTEPVFISEYEIADKRFSRIKSFEKLALFNNVIERKTKLENIYINQAARAKFITANKRLNSDE